MRVLTHLLKSIRSAAVFNPEVQMAPACILWPDRDRQWEAVIPRLQAELPELLMLGDYAPEKRTGPAIWLRCVIARKVDDVAVPGDRPPILYLPGFSRQDLRAVESCPDALKPLAELQYRGTIWSQINAKDWTILAFLKSDQGGLGLDVAQDNDTRSALQLALYRVLDEDRELLNGKRLDKDYFNTLLTGGDPVRDLLLWLDQGEGFQSTYGENEWKAFVEICKSQFAFNPQAEGVLAGVTRLASYTGPWKTVWDRFCEAPVRYPNIPTRLRQCKPPMLGLFADVETGGRWPQWNDDQERNLCHDLKLVGSLPPHDARLKLLELEKQHGCRRALVWAERGESSLAMALKHLAILAEVTTNSLAAGTAQELAVGYATFGWKADEAVLQALSLADTQSSIEAISTAIRAVYLQWAEESARHLQKVVSNTTYPGGTIINSKTPPRTEGECVLFVDGLRFDTGKRLAELLRDAGREVSEKTTWAALPSVTPTGKPAVTPVKDKIVGQESSPEFDPMVAATGQSLKGGYHLKKLFKENNWKTLNHTENGDGKGNAWCEFGDIDHEGHDRGWKLAKHIEGLLKEVRDRIGALLDAGWKSVRVVTDHGWLLMPGGLPKIELSSFLTDTKWARCAALKPGVSSEERLYPWFWNPNQLFALADGISCFRSSEEYSHGGLSLQECLTLELTVTSGGMASGAIVVEITDVSWKGLRCTVGIEGEPTGLSLDIRTQPGNAESSVVVSVKPLKANGTAAVVVENEDLEGHDAMLVLLDESGQVVAQLATVIGGGDR